MKALFLTSSVGGYEKTPQGKVPTKWNNSEHFVDRLKELCGSAKTFVFVASNPNGIDKNDEYASLVYESLKTDLPLQKLIVIDHRFAESIKDAINSADIVFLAGGHVPTQNAYFKEIGLKEILNDYAGVVIGQSAGSMNCSSVVYVQPENRNEFYDKSFQKQIDGLGFTDIVIMPHMNRAKEDEIDGTTTFDMCIADSHTIPHYGIYDGGYIEIDENSTISHGKTLLFRNGECEVVCEKGEESNLLSKQNNF